MSCGVNAYAVDLEALKKTIGCGDAVLAKRLVKTLGVATDEAEWLTSLVVDGMPSSKDGSSAGYALELVCRSVGERLPGAAFSGIADDDLDAIDAALKKGKSKRRIASLILRGSPLPLPPIDHFPAIGFLAAAEVAAWRSDLAKVLGKPKKRRKQADATPTTFSGRVEGKTLVVDAAGKRTVTSFASNKAAQKALIAALRKANAGGIVEDGLPGLRELLSWLEACAAKKLALVTWYY